MKDQIYKMTKVLMCNNIKSKIKAINKIKNLIINKCKKINRIKLMMK